jgi:transcriptional antiterminator RfaH
LEKRRTKFSDSLPLEKLRRFAGKTSSYFSQEYLDNGHFTGTAIAHTLQKREQLEHVIQMAEPEKYWFAVYTKPQKEEYAELNLRLRGIDTFFPKLFLPKAAKRKKQIVALFPNYLFVRCEIISEEYGAIVWCPGVKRLVSFNGTPAIVDDSIMEFLMGQTEADGVIAARCNVEVGQKVSIAGGPFDGLVGIIKEPPNARGRVKVLLQLLNRETNVDVPVQFISASWVTQAQSARS